MNSVTFSLFSKPGTCRIQLEKFNFMHYLYCQRPWQGEKYSGHIQVMHSRAFTPLSWKIHWIDSYAIQNIGQCISNADLTWLSHKHWPSHKHKFKGSSGLRSHHKMQPTPYYPTSARFSGKVGSSFTEESHHFKGDLWFANMQVWSCFPPWLLPKQGPWNGSKKAILSQRHWTHTLVKTIPTWSNYSHNYDWILIMVLLSNLHNYIILL